MLFDVDGSDNAVREEDAFRWREGALREPPSPAAKSANDMS